MSHRYPNEPWQCPQCRLMCWSVEHVCDVALRKKVWDQLEYIAKAWTSGFKARPDWFGWEAEWFMCVGAGPRIGEGVLHSWAVDREGTGYALVGDVMMDVMMHQVREGVVGACVAVIVQKDIKLELGGGVTMETTVHEPMEVVRA